MTPDEQASGLREAASHLGGPGSTRTSPLTVNIRVDQPGPFSEETTRERLMLPGVVAHPLRLTLLAAAEQIDAHGHTLGLPVSYALEIAGVIVGRDLGHNR